MASDVRMLISQTCLSLALFLWASGAIFAENVVVDAKRSHAVNTFSPIRALGAGVDRLKGPNRLKIGNAETVLGQPLLREILSAGWQTVSYRQNTELQVEGWHWNSRGTWSDPARQEGYFVGDAEPAEPIVHSFAYPLPHRGFTQGDGNGHSRLTDGDPATSWKSNPYLTSAFTGEDDSLHPQWVVMDLGARKDVNAIRIAWASPWARAYRVQFWTGEGEPFYEAPTKGAWQTFPLGNVEDGQAGTVTLQLAHFTIPVRHIRIWMTASSNTPGTHDPADKRNCVGYAIYELYAGTLSDDGRFTDLVTHVPDRTQTVTTPSSVDPWHAATDRDIDVGDQIGFDYFFNCGVTRGLPTMVPVAMIYSTPEDAAAEIAYLLKRKYRISWIEMGEEPDGQHMLPEDYGALYLQFAAAIHRVAPGVKLGGPSFEGVNEDVEVWPDAEGRASWLGRFLDYLKKHDRLSDFTFFSYEHYPISFEMCDVPWTELIREPERVRHILQVWKDDGLPPGLPQFMTEGNMHGGPKVVDLIGGLWLADFIGSYFTGGGNGTYYFHSVPSPLRASRSCEGEAGTMSALLHVDKDYKLKGYYAQYFATRLITQEWVQPVDKDHRIYPAASDVLDAAGNTLVTSYAVERPDGQWALMLVNRDRDNEHAVRVLFSDPESGRDRHFSGRVDRVAFGAAEYAWHPDGVNGWAGPDGPPSRSTVQGGAETLFKLPKASIVVLRGRIG